MIKPAEKLENNAPGLMYGRVAAIGDLEYEVLTDFGSMNAAKAFGCLIEPAPGDIVLLSVDARESCFILSVLIRETTGKEPTRINLPGPVDLRAHGGDLTISSDTDLGLIADRRMELTSGRVDLHADRGRVVVDRVTFLGRSLDFQIEVIKAVARSVEHIFDSFTQKFKNTWRFVADHEEIQSRTTRRLTEESLTVQAGNEYHLVEDTVKIDAERIHLG